MQNKLKFKKSWDKAKVWVRVWVTQGETPNIIYNSHTMRRIVGFWTNTINLLHLKGQEGSVNTKILEKLGLTFLISREGKCRGIPRFGNESGKKFWVSSSEWRKKGILSHLKLPRECHVLVDFPSERKKTLQLPPSRVLEWPKECPKKKTHTFQLQ